MKWLDRLFGRRASAAPPTDVDFGSAIGKLPVVEPSRFIRLHISADDRVYLEGQEVSVADLEGALTSMHQPGAVIDYSRENAAEDSVVVEPVLDCVIRLGFPLALPPEAIPELDRSLAGRNPHA